MANEKRLIELAEALRMVQNSKHDCPETSVKGRAIWATAHDCALSCLTSCNAVDAVEVVHGLWEKASETMPIYRCSICKERNLFKNGNNVLSNYCPNCGAKIDGGNEDETHL